MFFLAPLAFNTHLTLTRGRERERMFMGSIKMVRERERARENGGSENEGVHIFLFLAPLFFQCSTNYYKGCEREYAWGFIKLLRERE